MRMRRGANRIVLIVLAGAVISPAISPARASAQRRPPGADSVPGPVQVRPVEPAAPFYGLVVLVSVGSLAGSVSGALVGEGLGRSVGDDLDQKGALALGVLGGVMGSAAGALLANRGGGRLAFPEALAAGSAGILGGILATWALAPSDRGDRSYPDFFVTFSIGQGVAAAAVAALLGREVGLTH